MPRLVIADGTLRQMRIRLLLAAVLATISFTPALPKTSSGGTPPH